jgi:hypothetical protein
MGRHRLTPPKRRDVLKKLKARGLAAGIISGCLRNLNDPVERKDLQALKRTKAESQKTRKRVEAVQRSLDALVESAEWMHEYALEEIQELAELTGQRLGEIECWLDPSSGGKPAWRRTSSHAIHCRTLAEFTVWLRGDYGLTYPQIAALTQGESREDAWFKRHEMLSGENLRDARERVVGSLRQGAHRSRGA